MSEGNFFSSSVRSSSNTVSSSSLDTQGQGGGKNTWLDSINSPLIQEDGDGKSLKLRFDVSQYQPEEIVVKTVDNKLLVSWLTYFDNVFFVRLDWDLGKWLWSEYRWSRRWERKLFSHKTDSETETCIFWCSEVYDKIDIYTQELYQFQIILVNISILLKIWLESAFASKLL